MTHNEQILDEAEDAFEVVSEEKIVSGHTSLGVKLPGQLWLLLCEIKRLSRQKGYAWISNEALAKSQMVHRTTIIDRIQKLEAMGFIRVERTRRTRKIWPLPMVSNWNTQPEASDTLRVGNCDSESHKLILSESENTTPLYITTNKKDYTNKEDIERIFDAWRSVLDHPKAQLDEKRTKIIAERLKDFTADELCRVPEGARRSSFHMGQNDRARKYDDIRILFRDAEQVEKFLELAEPPKPVLNKPPVRDEYDELRMMFANKDRKYR